MNKKTLFTFVIIFLIHSLMCIKEGTSKELSAGNLPFSEKEELTYDLTWMGILAGTAKISITGRINKWNRKVYHVSSRADSSDFLSLIYKVEDRASTYIDANRTYPLYYSIKQREGRYRADRTIIFDQKNNRASFIKNVNPPKEFSIPPDVQDPLSSFFFVRSKKLTVGKSLYVNTFSGTMTYRVEVQVIKKERIKTILGKVDTIVIKPILDFPGIFRHKGNIYIWLTDDQKRLPVRMKTEIVFGAVSATLTGYTR